jgi:hypothetical protein
MFEMRVWHWLYVACFAFLGLTVVIVYRISMTGDLSMEWTLLVLMALAMASFLVGWFLEREYKKKQPPVGLEELL